MVDDGSQYDYSGALKRRLDSIGQLGINQTTWERAQQQRRVAQEQADQANAMYSAQQQGNDIAGQNNQGLTSTGGTTTGNSFESFKNAISAQESGGNYSARNPSGAMGKYQIMPANLGGNKSGWDYAALGYDVTTDQFMKSPEIQEKIASHQLQGYYDKYGPAGAAIAWYSGESNAIKYKNGNGVGTNAQGNYPSINSYAQQILKKMGLA